MFHFVFAVILGSINILIFKRFEMVKLVSKNEYLNQFSIFKEQNKVIKVIKIN